MGVSSLIYPTFLEYKVTGAINTRSMLAYVSVAIRLDNSFNDSNSYRIVFVVILLCMGSSLSDFGVGVGGILNRYQPQIFW